MDKTLEYPSKEVALYRTMHNSHLGYRFTNQGVKSACDWFHLLRDKRGEVHNPWTDTPITILEIGCGNGILCELLASMSFDVTGVDLFDNEIIYKREGYKFVQQNLVYSPYPFEDRQFDYCISFDVLEHLEEKHIDAILREMARLSRGIILKVSCHGIPPLHITVKTPGWWLNKLTENCPDFSWRLVRNVERIEEDDGKIGHTLLTHSDIRPFTDGKRITYAPLFYGKRGVIANED